MCPNGTLWVEPPVLWEEDTGDPVASSPSIVTVSSEQGRVFVGAGGDMLCMDALTGSVIWYYATGGTGVDTSPTVHTVNGAKSDKVVSFGSYSLYPSSGKLHTLFVENGSELWSYPTEGIIGASSAGVRDGRIMFGSEDWTVYCLNASTGTSLWNYTTGDIVNSSPTLTEDRVYIGSFDDHVYCLNASTGELIWSFATNDDVGATPAVAYGRVYVGSYDGRMYCLNASDGRHLWNYTTGNYVSSSPAVWRGEDYETVAQGKVYFGSYDYNVYCLNASTGELIWNYATGSYVVSSPAITDRYLFIGSWDGKVYCLNTTDGHHLWNYTTSGRVSSSPSIGLGLVYVGSNDGNVYAFGMSPSLHVIEYGELDFDVDIVSNSMLSAFSFDQSMKTLRFNVTGDPGTTGYSTVTFPITLLGGPYVCQLNGTLITPEVYTNATHTALAFLYDHSTHTIEIVGTTVIPEFPTPLTMGFLLLILAAATGLVKRLRSFTSQRRIVDR
jgi:outer membrane protein assembly factor BamB